MKIIIDHRERSSGIIKELSKQGVDVEVKQLKIADYVLQSRTAEGKIVNVGVERKTSSDFLNSIIDKRILKQLIILKENFDIPLLIIEGVENIYQIRNFHPNSIRGMLSSIAIDYQVPVLYTRNYRDTAALLVVIGKRLEKGRKVISLLDRRKPLSLAEMQQYIVESFPGVGPTIAKALLKKFKNIKNIANASEEELMDVEKIGKIKAKEIKKVLETEF